MNTLYLGPMPTELDLELPIRLGDTAAVIVRVLHTDYNGTASIAKLRQEFSDLPARTYDAAIKKLKSRKILIVYTANNGALSFDMDYRALEAK